MKKLFNYTEYHKLFEEFNLDNVISKKLDINMLDIVFSDIDVEKVLVNAAQIISIISSFFGRFGMRVSLTIESLLFLYWIWKFEKATTKADKQDALIQLIFASIGFVILGAGPAFKAISKSFSNGYKEYKLTGSAAKMKNSAEFKVLAKNENALKKAAKNIDNLVEENLEKLPKDLVSASTKAEIKETSKGVKKYVDELFEAESKAAKSKPKVKGKNVRKSAKMKKTAGKLIKLGKRLFPIASYLLKRYLNKEEKPAEHFEAVENDFAILQYQIDDNKIVGADFPEDLTNDTRKRENKNGAVVPTIIGIKFLVEDFDNKKVIGGYNILTELDKSFQYYIACAVNGEPIYNNFKIFALKNDKILISKLTQNNLEFNDARDIIPELKIVKLISNEDADDITKKNFEKVLKAYGDNLNTINSYAMWSKIIEKTFTRTWWDKNFKLKESE